MRIIVLFVVFLVLCAGNAIVCDAVLAGPIDNAAEFQNKIVEQEEARAENIGSKSAGDNIKWDDTDSSDNQDEEISDR